MTTKERLFFREHQHDGLTQGAAILGTKGNFTIGTRREDGIDYWLTFGGYSNDGVLTWMEDEDYLQSSDDFLFSSTEAIYFRDTALGVYSAEDGYLDLFADTDVRINTYPIRPIPIDGLYLNITGDDPASEIGYGTWNEETNVSVNFSYLTLGTALEGATSYLTFRGFYGDGVFEWLDGEQQFRIYDDLILWYPASVMFSDSQSYITDDGTKMYVVTDGPLVLDSTVVEIRNGLQLPTTGDGTQVGTAADQLLAFWGATPAVQPTTGVGEATFAENAGGTAVNEDSTFDGYTLGQVVKALRDMGILA